MRPNGHVLLRTLRLIIIGLGLCILLIWAGVRWPGFLTIPGISAYLPQDAGKEAPHRYPFFELLKLVVAPLLGVVVAAGDEFRFSTAGAHEFDFLAFGDCGLGTGPQDDIAQRMYGENPALALITGDVVYMSGSYAEYEEHYFPYYGDMMRRVPFFPTLGNHDVLTQNGGPYLALHALPTADVPPLDQGRYYSFDWGNVHFISLDTVTSIFDAVNGKGKMLEWLQQDLERTNSFWRIVYFHHPPYSSGIHDADAAAGLVRDHIVPILDRHKVDLVFAGHEHSYQRTHPMREGKVVEDGEGTIYITTGGGGGDLYPVYETPRLAFGESAYHYVRLENRRAYMTARVIRIDGKEIDIVTLRPPPTICSSFLSPQQTSRPLEWNRPVATIYGRHLASEEQQATDLPFPRMLGGTRVSFRGRPLPLLSVSDTKIEVQVPLLRQFAQLRVETPNGSAETNVIFAEQPGERICR